MINHIIEYVKLFNPLKRGSIAVSDPDGLAGTLSQIRADDKKSDGPAALPRFLRVLISSDDKEAEGERLVKEFEANSQKVHEHRLNWIKLMMFISFTAGICLSYFLYWSVFNFHIIWVPGESFITFFFGGCYNWWIFYTVAILSYSIVPSFITYFFGRKRWVRTHGYSKYTRLFSEMGKDRREKFRKQYVDKGLKILKEKADKARVDVSRIRILVDEIFSKTNLEPNFAKEWIGKFNQALEILGSRCPNSFRGEIANLQDLSVGLIEQWRQGFRFVPLMVVTPSSETKGISELAKTDVSLSILRDGFKNKAKNLKAFLEEVKPLQEKIWTNFELLEEVGEKSERVEILQSLQDGFERMRNISSGFHFGDNPYIPHQRGRNVSDLYDKLYELVGKAKNDIREGKKAARALIFSKLPVKTEGQQKRRISRLMLKLERVLGQEIEHSKTYDRISRAFAWWGATLSRSVALSLVLFFVFASILSFEVLSPGQVLVTRPLMLGVKEKVTQKERVISRSLDISYPDEGIPVGFGKRLFWHLPNPITWSRKVELENSQRFNSFSILSQLGPGTLWQKTMSLIAGVFGGSYFEVSFIDFEFKVKDKDTWIQLDFDGQGLDRLNRDITPMIDQWKDGLFNFYEENFLVDIKDEGERKKIYAGDFIERLSRDGTLKKIIQYQISQYVAFGYEYRSYIQRIGPGVDAIENDLKRRESKIKMDLVEVADKEKALKEVEEFRKWVTELREEIEKQAKKEYATLRKNPELLKKIMENPRENIKELKDFEMVWLGIQQAIVQKYGMDKFKKMLNGELGKRKKEELIERLNKKIAEDEYFGSLLEITDIRVKVRFLDSHKYQQQIQRKMMSLAELT